MEDQNMENPNMEDPSMDGELLGNRMNLELESIGLNQLNDLGNKAISLGLIAGHGHHGGQYELLHQGKVVTISPGEAVTYLENLIQEVGE
ncbi:MAG: hypothetical protein LH679_15025 [Cyanobacteria bacterium CAN_BIN43]|nr:hypothetical protein [Cyanobacteria bacterium CAN_BIN43]